MSCYFRDTNQLPVAEVKLLEVPTGVQVHVPEPDAAPEGATARFPLNTHEALPLLATAVNVALPSLFTVPLPAPGAAVVIFAPLTENASIELIGQKAPPNETSPLAVPA